ncbi:ATP-binding protein [Microbacterium sp. NPDC076895]|uniref:ATP-binding protein n=1 Tax=Microbacterium sp. NPDC076895 TaxID=3154957 RepID=UPI0034453177
MVGGVFAAHDRRESGLMRTPPWWRWLIAGVAIFVLSQMSVVLTPSGSSIAAWWPAAGVSALFILRTPRRNWWLVIVMVMVVTAAANAAAGRSLDVSASFGVANAVEVGVFAIVLQLRRPNRLLLNSVSNAWRFAVSTLAASAVLGLLVALVVAQVSSEAFVIGAHAAASHAAAILMIAPFAVLPPHIGQPTPWGEIVAQITILSGILVYLAAADAAAPLTFLPVGILAWAAYRFPIRGAYAESLAAGVVVLVTTVAGLGPFTHSSLPPEVATLVVVLYLFMTSSTNLFLSAASYEIRSANRAAQSVSELVTSGVVDSRIGLLVVERRSEAWTVLLSNTASRRMLSSDIDSDQRWARSPLRDAMERSLRDGDLVTFETADHRVLTVDASPVKNVADRVSVQVIDVTDSTRLAEERIATERDRAATLAAQLELERRQVDFVATASHELRTPITSVSGYLELIDESNELSEPSREWLAIASRNARRLQELIDDLLVIARVSRPSSSPAPRTSVAVSDIVHDAAIPYDAAARERGVRLDLGQLDGTVRASRHEVVRALGCLISNAVKFTASGGHVQVASTTEELDDATDAASAAVIRITVTDNGSGIAADDLPHVFEQFYRTGDAAAAIAAGAGLGLTIAREIAEANDGRVEIASDNRQGVVASLILPAVSESMTP